MEDTRSVSVSFADDIAPIILVGINRSGKSLLASCLSHLDRVSWWSEPNSVWRIGAAYRSHDRRLARDATKRVAYRIRRAYAKQQRAVGGRRLVDDSPFHCLSVPFIRELFPEAKLIHVFRDGRDVIYDVLESWAKPSYALERKTIVFLVDRLKQSPISEWPAYLPRVIKGLVDRILRRKSTRRRHAVRYPGSKQDFRTLSNEQLACKQWSVCQEYALDDLSACPSDSYINVAYEALVRKPAATFSRILDFLEEPMNDALRTYLAEQITTAHVGRGHMLFDKGTQDHLLPFLEPTLSRVEKLIREQETLFG